MSLQCSQKPLVPTKQNIQKVIIEITDGTIVPTMTDFSRSLDQLKLQAESFCKNPEQPQLLALQNQWRTTSALWSRASIYLFGPLNQNKVFPEYTFIDGLRLRGTNYLTSVRTDIANDLSAPTPNWALSAKTFQHVGLLPIEVLLFDGKTGISIADSYMAAPNKCLLLKAHIALTEQHAMEVSNAWQNTYGQKFKAGQLEGEATSLLTLLHAIQSHLDYLRKRDVVSLSTPLSNQSWANMSAMLKEVTRLLQGDATLSIFELMRGNNHLSDVTTVQKNLAFAKQTIQNKDLVQFNLALSLLEGNIKRQAPEALNVEWGINFSDGD